MRILTADYIYPVSSRPIKNGIIVCDDYGKILQLINPSAERFTTDTLERFNGILVPGFVNAHCHLELSYLINKITPKTGLSGFVRQIQQNRIKEYCDEIEQAIIAAQREATITGTIAMGDICNSTHTIATKISGHLKYYNFVEIFGIDETRCDKFFENALTVYNQFREQLKTQVSIVPHAPYSLSGKLFDKIKSFNKTKENIISIHNQESEAENKLFQDKSGEMYNTFINAGLNYSNFETTGKNSLESILNYLPRIKNTLFVHNTFSTQNDIDAAKKYYRKNIENVFWVFCVNSNLFIENRLPNLNLFRQNKLNIALGTDSLASTASLNMLDEIKTIAQNFPDISFETILQWATINGARALKFDADLGSLETNKTPGINLIENFDLNKMTITQKSRITKLI